MIPIAIQVSRSKVKVKDQAYFYMLGKWGISVLQISILERCIVQLRNGKAISIETKYKIEQALSEEI